MKDSIKENIGGIILLIVFAAPFIGTVLYSIFGDDKTPPKRAHELDIIGRPPK